MWTKSMALLGLRGGLKLVMLGLLLTVAGCGDARQEKVDRGVRKAESIFREISTNPFAAATFQEQAEFGGTYVSFLTASLESSDDYPPFCNDSPSQPWCVVLKKGATSDEVVIEGYGEDLSKPTSSTVVTLRRQ